MLTWEAKLLIIDYFADHIVIARNGFTGFITIALFSTQFILVLITLSIICTT